MYYANKSSESIQVATKPQVVVKKDNSSGTPTKKDNTSESKKEEKKEEKITLSVLKNKMDSALSDTDYEYIDNGIKKILSEEKESKEFALFEKNYNIKKQGYYYNKGRADMKSGNSKSAIDNFTKAYNAKKGEYLDPHITYSLGCAIMKDNPKESTKYFEEYLTKYNKMDTSYEEESLYNLAIINMELNNKSKAKKYAQRLQDRYENSMYNNVKLKEILK